MWFSIFLGIISLNSKLYMIESMFPSWFSKSISAYKALIVQEAIVFKSPVQGLWSLPCAFEVVLAAVFCGLDT